MLGSPRPRPPILPLGYPVEPGCRREEEEGKEVWRLTVLTDGRKAEEEKEEAEGKEGGNWPMLCVDKSGKSFLPRMIRPFRGSEPPVILKAPPPGARLLLTSSGQIINKY